MFVAFSICLIMLFMPVIDGIPIDLAIIAVCEVRPSFSVIKPATLSILNVANSSGVILSEIIIKLTFNLTLELSKSINFVFT